MADELRTNRIAAVVTIGTLYILSSPIFAVRAVARAIAGSRARKAIRSSFLQCPDCSHRNRLNVLVQCRGKDCGWTEHRSLALPCSRCGERWQEWINCAVCGASIELP